MTAGDKAINYLSIVAGAVVGILAGLAIYRRTMARAAELQRGEGAAAAAEDAAAGYDDLALLDPDDAAAAMSDDDVSLWDSPQPRPWRAEYHDDVAADMPAAQLPKAAGDHR